MEKENERKNDRCVCCGAITDYDTSVPVKDRACYVEGAGQLCSPCFMSTYGYAAKKNTW